MRIRYLLICLFVASCFILQGQGDFRITGKSLSELQHSIDLPLKLASLPPTLLQLFPHLPTETHPPLATSLLLHPGKQPAAYSYDLLGLFCKFEVQLEKATRFPIKFRLGEVQYTEGLEGKDRWGEPFRVTERQKNVKY